MTVNELIDELKKLNSPQAEVSVDLFDDGGGNEAGTTHPGMVESVHIAGDKCVLVVPLGPPTIPPEQAK
jgi:hypothetical protein